MNSKNDYQKYHDTKINEYQNCEHLLITYEIDYNERLPYAYGNLGCIKCGLKFGIYYKNDKANLTPDEKIMLEYLEKQMNEHNYFTGEDIYWRCNLDLATAVVRKIKEKHPNIDNATLEKYFKIAMVNMDNSRVTPERLENRAKRLSLKPEFNAWKKINVIRR